MPYTQARVDAALDAANANVAHAQLHLGDPGVDGTGNPSSEASTETCVMPAASSGESEQVVTFTISDAEGPYTHISLWSDSGGSPDVFQGSGTLTPQEEFQGAGTLEVTVTTTASST